MPTYDYRCDACGHAFEEFQSMSAKPLRTCPKCKKAKLKRLIGTGAGFIFKGGGFWETDYRSESYKKGEKAEADALSAATKSESKPESKSETKSDTPAKNDAAAAKAEPAAPKKEATKAEAPKPAPAKSESKPTKDTKKSRR